MQAEYFFKVFQSIDKNIQPAIKANLKLTKKF